MLIAVRLRRAVEPHVLRPMAVRFLRHLQISQHAPDVPVRTHRDESTSGLHKVTWSHEGAHPASALTTCTWPQEVIAPKVVVRLGEAPRDRQAGNDAALHAFGFV